MKFYEVIVCFLNSNQLLVFCCEENVDTDKQPVVTYGFDPCEKYHSIQLKTKHKNYFIRISYWDGDETDINLNLFGRNILQDLKGNSF